MDRTGIIAVVVCGLAYIILATEFARMYPHPAPAALAAASTAPVTPASSATPLPATTLAAAPASTPASASAVPAAGVPAQENVLENADLKATFTSAGAAIETIDLKKHREGNGDVILNAKARDAILSLSGWPGTNASAFQVQAAPRSLVYSTTLPGGVRWTRSYTLGDGYLITVQDALANPGTAEATLPAYSLNIGRAEPLRIHGKYQPNSSIYVGAGWLTATKFHLTTMHDFDPAGWFFNRTPGRDLFTSTTVDPAPLRWLAVQDQFFAVLLTPDARHPLPQATFQTFNTRDESGRIPATDEPNIEASADFPGVTVPAGQTVSLSYTLYTGPKDYGTLNALGDNQGELLNYDGILPFSVLIVPMLGVLHFFNGAVHSSGVAIILLTLVIKVLTWPLQSFANRSGKRMQALAPKIKELQAKYKEQPEKLSSETFALYRDFGVNPFGGCLPALVQMPVFFSLYYMLQNAVELRGQHFLWVRDLTLPDTVFSHDLGFSILGISHLVINPLPIMVTALMALMMRLTPQMGDPQQQKVAQFMPLFFLFLFYNFAAALSLYYVINNCVSIIQIYRNLKKPLPELKRKPKKIAPARA